MIVRNYSYTGDPKVISEVAAKAVSVEGLEVVEATPQGALIFQKIGAAHRVQYMGSIEFNDQTMRIDLSPTDTYSSTTTRRAVIFFLLVFPIIHAWNVLSRRPKQIIENIVARIASELQAHPGHELVLL